MTLQGFKRRKRFVEEYQEIISDNQMNWWIRHRDSNGLSESGALVKAANQWYINVDKFTQWFTKQIG